MNQAQGRLYEATAEVGRLEAEIRYVVEGRQRVEQRLVQLAEQIAQWQARREEADAELERLAGAGVDAEEKAELLAAQVEEQALRLPDLEDALRQSQNNANEQRNAVAQVQQQIQVLAAEQRNIDEQSRQLETRFERLRADRNALAAPTKLAWPTCAASSMTPPKPGADGRPARGTAGGGAPADDERRERQQAVNQETARQTDLSARMEALKALQEKVKTDGKLRPWLAKHGLDSLQGLWSRIHIEPGWENALEAAARAPERARSRAPGHGAWLCRRRWQRRSPARLAFFTPRRRPAGACGSLPRLATCCAWTTPACAPCWPTGCRAATPPDPGRSPEPA